MDRVSLLLKYVVTILSLFIILGQSQGRFKASNILSDPQRKDCYQATLTISDVISSDSRTYFVTIANDRGETRYDVSVRAIDPVPMVALVGVIATALSLILFIILCVAYTFKSKNAASNTNPEDRPLNATTISEYIPMNITLRNDCPPRRQAPHLKINPWASLFTP